MASSIFDDFIYFFIFIFFFIDKIVVVNLYIEGFCKCLCVYVLLILSVQHKISRFQKPPSKSQNHAGSDPTSSTAR